MNRNSFQVLRGHLFRELTAAALCALVLVQSVQAAAPAWWSTQGVRNSQKVADDYAVLNQGQLKNLIRAAVVEMNVELPGGAGTELNTLLETWRTQKGNADDYAAASVGQLKALAKKVYQRLEAAHVSASAPWSAAISDDDDHAAANIGQAKRVFSFAMPDSLMMAALDSDEDGFSDLDEFWAGSGIHDASSMPNGGYLSNDQGATLNGDDEEGGTPAIEPEFIFYHRAKSDFAQTSAFLQFDTGFPAGTIPRFFATRTQEWSYLGSEEGTASGSHYTSSTDYSESIHTLLTEQYANPVRTGSMIASMIDAGLSNLLGVQYLADEIEGEGGYSRNHTDYSSPLWSTSYSAVQTVSGSFLDDSVVTHLQGTVDGSNESNTLHSFDETWNSSNFQRQVSMMPEWYTTPVTDEFERTATLERAFREYHWEQNGADGSGNTWSSDVNTAYEWKTTLSGEIAVAQVAAALKASLEDKAWPETFENPGFMPSSRCDVSYYGWNMWAEDVEYYVVLEWPENTPESVKEQDHELRKFTWTETYESQDHLVKQSEWRSVSLRPGEQSEAYALSAISVDATRTGSKAIGRPSLGLQAHEVLADGTISPAASGIQASMPSPIIGMTCELRNVHVQADGQIVGDVALMNGTITSSACDTIQGAKGKITKAQLWVNNAEEPQAQINVTATKEENGPRHKPYPYSGSFEQVINNVPLSPGTNVFKVTAEDEVYHMPGYNTWAANVQVNGPEDEEVDPVVFAGVAGVNERFALTVQLPQPWFAWEPDTLTATLDLNGTAHADVELTETEDDNGIFIGTLPDGRAVHLTLGPTAVPDYATRDILQAELVLGEGAGAVTRTLTLGESAADSGLFSGGQSFTSFTAASGGSSGAGGGVGGTPPGAGGATTLPTLQITTGYAFPLQQSNGGELHQYALGLDLPQDVLERSIVKIGERTLKVTHDETSGLNLLEDPNHAGEPLLSTFRAPEDTPGPQPDDKKLYNEMRDRDYLYGFMIGFKAAGVDMISDSLGIIKGAGMYMLRSYAGINVGVKLIWQKLTDSDEVYETEELFIQLGEEQDQVHQDVIALAKFLSNFIEPLLPLGPAQLQLQIDLLTGAWQGNLAAAEKTALNASEAHRKVFSLVSGALAEMKKDYQDGTPGQKGYITGRIVFEAASMVFAYTKLGKLAQLKKAAFLEKILSTRIPGTNMRKAFRPLIVLLKKTGMCFVAGTLVLTLEGLLPIEQVRGGMYVWSRDEESGQMGWKRVLQTFTTHPSVIHHLTYELRGPPESSQQESGPLSPRAASGSRSASVPLAAGESKAASRRLAPQTETLGVTAPHPFFVRNREQPGFIAAEELVPGDELFVSGHHQAVVVTNTAENAPAGETFTTYNFEVEDFHTYFVGRNGVWVHNSGGFNCDELFEIWYLKLKHFEGDHWNAFNNLMVDPPPAWASWPERWRLRGFNEVRLDWFTSPSPGSTPPPWRNALVNRPGASKSADELAKNINAALGFTKKPEGFTAHHILMTVTSESNEYWKRMKKLSEEGQDILRRNGNIDINDASNGTYLPSTGAKAADFSDEVYGPRHMAPGEPNFHTEDYLTAVVAELRKVDGQGRNAVTDKLQEIAARIIERDFPGIPPSS